MFFCLYIHYLSSDDAICGLLMECHKFWGYRLFVQSFFFLVTINLDKHGLWAPEYISTIHTLIVFNLRRQS